MDPTVVVLGAAAEGSPSDEMKGQKLGDKWASRVSGEQSAPECELADNEHAGKRGEIGGLSSGERQTVPQRAKLDKFKHFGLARVKLRPKARVKFPWDQKRVVSGGRESSGGPTKACRSTGSSGTHAEQSSGTERALPGGAVSNEREVRAYAFQRTAGRRAERRSSDSGGFRERPGAEGGSCGRPRGRISNRE